VGTKGKKDVFKNRNSRGPLRRLFVTFALILAWLLKPFKFLHPILPFRLRELSKTWDSTMIWTVLMSGNKRFFMDQNAKLPDPPSFQPRIQTRPEWQFTEDQIRQFYQDGFIGPITLWTPEEMAEIKRTVTNVLESGSSKVYPDAKNILRDRYIDRPDFWDVISSPRITERLAQFLGPDLLVWRSQIFNKNSGDPETTWHQATTYMLEQMVKPALEPKNLNELFQLTTWIAIDDAYVENGCMFFLKGTQRKVWTFSHHPDGLPESTPGIAKTIAGSGQFGEAKGIFLDVDITKDMVAPMPLKSGQCVIFTERCVHGAPPNKSPNRRFGFVFRTIKTDVEVYRGEKNHEVGYLRESYDLSNWGCALLRGEDKYHLNKLIQPPTYDREFSGASTTSVSGS
jgi:non-heme Fe2+,alpha-ketoglutarate-dependent halogenase